MNKRHQRNHSWCVFGLTMVVMLAPAHPGCAGGGPGGLQGHLERVSGTTEVHRAHVEEDRMSGIMIWCDKDLERSK